MADDDVRRAERAWRESGSSADEALYLRERVRSGTLTTPRLELAAYLGHPAARQLVDAGGDRGDLQRWNLGLARFGRPVLIRAAHAAAASARSLWEQRPSPRVDHLGTRSPAERLDRVARWLACPCEPCAHAVSHDLDRTQESAVEVFGWTPWAFAHDAAIDAASSIAPRHDEDDPSLDAVSASALSHGLTAIHVERVARVNEANREERYALFTRAAAAGSLLVRAAIRDALVAWALA